MGVLIVGGELAGVRFGALEGVELLGELDMGEVVMGASAWRFAAQTVCYSAMIARGGPGGGWEVQYWGAVPMESCDRARAREASAPAPAAGTGGETSPFVSIPALEIPALVNRADPAAVNAAWVAALQAGDLATVELLFHGGPYADAAWSPDELAAESGALATGGYMGLDLGALLAAQPLGAFVADGRDGLVGLSRWSFAGGGACFAAMIGRPEGAADWVVYDWVRAADAVCEAAIAQGPTP